MNLVQALRFQNHDLSKPIFLAIAGAGGKTTALFQFARQYSKKFQHPALVTTTTHLATHQLALADRLFVVREAGDIQTIGAQLSPGVNLVIGEEASANRVGGPDPHNLLRLYDLAQGRGLPLLIEADGSRQRPLKAPADYEPAIPSFVNRVLVVAGLSALGQPLESAWVHRPDRFAALTGMQPGEAITSEALGRILLDDAGGLKNIPEGALRAVLLNQADTPELRHQAQPLARRLLSSYGTVLVSSLGQEGTVFAAYEPVAGIILAAGEGRRFKQTGWPDQPKLLLPWRGKPLVRHVVQTALEGGLAPVVVVTGAYTTEIEQVLQDLPVIIARNPNWQAGQSSSLHTGLSRLPPQVGAAVFLLGDQPQVPAALVRDLAELHASTLNPLAAPRVKGRRANPVLVDTNIFPDLFALSGDTGGRALFSEPQRYPVDWLDWPDEHILLDVDTEQDYRLLEELKE